MTIINLHHRSATVGRKLRMTVLALGALMAALAARGQSDAQFSQYYEVRSYYNPAAIGTGDMLKIRGGGRLQWMGIDGAPRSFAATAEMPVKVMTKRLGVGVVMQQESMGLYRNLTLAAQLGYKIKLLGGELTPAVQVGFINQTWKGTEVDIPTDDNYHDSGDDAIPRQDLTGYALDLGAGVYYTRKELWVGVSATHVNQPSVKLTSEAANDATEKSYEYTVGRTFYFMAGYNIPIKNTLFEVMPSVMVKSDLHFTTGEINARLRYRKFLSAGLGYRYKDAVTINLGAEIKGFYLGYSYDYPTSAIAKVSHGSHEVWLGYQLKLDFSEKNKNRHKSIRIM